MSSQVPREIIIKQATTPTEIAASRLLFTKYVDWLNLDLTFQNFSHELASLPGLYSPPTGALFLALWDNQYVGCIALRPLPSKPAHEKTKICEMKRLYCTEQARGKGVGRKLVEAALKEAENLGYDEMRLDTLPLMEGARNLYRSVGFKEIEAYYQTPLEGTIFLSKTLKAG